MLRCNWFFNYWESVFIWCTLLLVYNLWNSIKCLLKRQVRSINNHSLVLYPFKHVCNSFFLKKNILQCFSHKKYINLTGKWSQYEFFFHINYKWRYVQPKSFSESDFLNKMNFYQVFKRICNRLISLSTNIRLHQEETKRSERLHKWWISSMNFRFQLHTQTSKI